MSHHSPPVRPRSPGRTEPRTRRAHRATLAALSLFSIISSHAAFEPSETRRREFWDANGTVNAIVATNGVVYIAGNFNSIAPKGRKAGAFDFYTATANTEFPKIYGSSVDAIVDDGYGGWYLGGEFHEVGGLPRTNLVHLLPTLAVDPIFQPNPDKRVRALLFHEDTLYLGGEFSTVAGETRNLLAALEGAAHTLLPWNPNASRNGSATRRISALATDGDLLYVGGLFSAIGGAARTNLAALDPLSATATPGWNPAAIGEVLTLAAADGELFVGGSFNSVSGHVRNGLAAIDTATGNVRSWNPNPQGGNVQALVVDCNTIYVGGSFTNLGGLPRARVGAIDTKSALPTDWNPEVSLLSAPGAPSSILDLELFGDVLYLAGEFASVNGQPQRDIAALDRETAALLDWDPLASGGVTTVAAAGRIVLAGFLASPGGVERANLAAFDELTGRPLDWNPGTDAEVLTLAAAEDRLYLGGRFTRAAGQPRAHLAAVELISGTLVPDWNPEANTNVHAIVTDGSWLYAGGEFTVMDGVNRLRLAKIDLASGAATPSWTPTVSDNTVLTLALDANTLYLGGSFSFVNATTRRRLAALTTSSGALLDWNPDANAPVRSLAVSTGAIYAGGDFSTIGTDGRSRLAALDKQFGWVLPWNPNADAQVLGIAIADSTVFVAGSFTTMSGAERWGLAAVDSNGSLSSWHPGSGAGFNEIRTLALSHSMLYAGGIHELRFKTSPAVHSFIAFPQTGAPNITSPPRDLATLPGPGQTARFVAAATGAAPLHYQWTYNGAVLPNETNAALSLHDVDPTNAGPYQVIVTNQLGASFAEAILTILQPAIITAQPINPTPVTPGSDVTLSVAATGNPPPLYQWRLNGANIPGAVFPTLTLTNVHPSDGGTYHVVVANGLNAESSTPVQLIVTTAPLPFSNSFDGRGSISAPSGTGQGSNVGASLEVGEPRHAGKLGGQSVWLSWTPSATGIATFSTRGSSFDTLLAVYTATNLESLADAESASDEDRGGFFTSQATFNATIGTEYAIAIDGLAGASGSIVFTWNLDTTTTDLPRITADPLSQSVTPNGTAIFSVTVASPTPVSYQWFFNCRELPGETSNTLEVSHAQRRDVGNYRVVVRNAANRAVESLPAALELGPNPLAVSIDKLADALEVIAGTGGGRSLAGGTGGGGTTSDALLVGLGSIVSQTIDTSDNTTSAGDPNYCGVSGGASAMLYFVPQHDGVVLVDTIGSSFDTVLAVLAGLNLVDCDNDGAFDGIRSQVRFTASANTDYLAVVDGVNGAKGSARINWQLGLPPVIDPDNSTRTNYLQPTGSSLTLEAFPLLQSDPPAAYQWWLNGQPIAGATGSTLTLQNLQAASAGQYTVIASNFAGFVAMDVAELTLEIPILSSGIVWTEQGPELRIRGVNATDYLFQQSGDLVNWVTLMTNRPGDPPLSFDIPSFQTNASSFYRAYPIPPPEDAP